MGHVTGLRTAIGEGEPGALGELYALLYPELHRLAHSRVRRSGELTLLDTTSLVHESYLRFEKSGALQIAGRSQFMAYAARVSMRPPRVSTTCACSASPPPWIRGPCCLRFDAPIG